MLVATFHPLLLHSLMVLCSDRSTILTTIISSAPAPIALSSFNGSKEQTTTHDLERSEPSGLWACPRKQYLGSNFKGLARAPVALRGFIE